MNFNQKSTFQHLSRGEQQSLIQQALARPARMAVIGLSPVANRPSYGVTRYMIEQGFEVFGVRPASPPRILDRPCVERLRDLNEAVDIIDVFRNSDALPDLVSEIREWLQASPMKERMASTRPVCLWLQEGVTHEAAERAAIEMGLLVIADRCILKEDANLR